MTVTTPATARREPAFPHRIFAEQAWFALFAWIGLSVLVLVITFIVSLFRPIEISVWELASEGARWFAFAIGIYLGWTILQLYVTHGGTRRGFAIQMLSFWPVYSVLLAVLTTVTFVVESGAYGLMGWSHKVDEGMLFSTAAELPMVLVQFVLIYGLWTLGGILMGVAWYRNMIVGAVMIPLGLAAITVSAASTGGEVGPMRWIVTIFPAEPGLGTALLSHAVLFVLFVLLMWLCVKNVPIRGKSVEPN